MPAREDAVERTEASAPVAAPGQAMGHGAAFSLSPSDRILALQRSIGNRAVGRMLRSAAQRGVARQPTATPGDKRAGNLVDYIVINRTSGHAVFHTIYGEPITGSVWTDLQPGTYTVKPSRNLAVKPGGPSMQWVFDPGQVRSGARFDVELTNALPETLMYPDTGMRGAALARRSAVL